MEAGALTMEAGVLDGPRFCLADVPVCFWTILYAFSVCRFLSSRCFSSDAFLASLALIISSNISSPVVRWSSAFS